MGQIQITINERDAEDLALTISSQIDRAKELGSEYEHAQAERLRDVVQELMVAGQAYWTRRNRFGVVPQPTNGEG